MSGQHRAPNTSSGITIEPLRVLSLVLIAAAPLISFTLSHAANNGVTISCLVLQLDVAISAWYLGEKRAKTLQQQRLVSRQETFLALGHTLDPVMVELAKTAGLNRGERRAMKSGLVSLILGAATGLGPEDEKLRASYFRLEPGATPRRMRHVLSVGRAGAAKADFTEGTLAGNTALRMIDVGNHLFCDDVEANPPPGWEASKRGEYKTFISVSVRSGTTPYGMLTLDAEPVGSLTEEDVKLLRVFGHVLAVVEVTCA